MNSEIFSMFRCLEIDNEKEKREATPRTWTRRAAPRDDTLEDTRLCKPPRKYLCANTNRAGRSRGAFIYRLTFAFIDASRQQFLRVSRAYRAIVFDV